MPKLSLKKSNFGTLKDFRKDIENYENMGFFTYYLSVFTTLVTMPDIVLILFQTDNKWQKILLFIVIFDAAAVAVKIGNSEL